MTREFRRAIATALLLLPATSGCMRALSSASAQPAALYTRQLCPGLQYDVVGEFNEGWTGWGFLGVPLNDTPNFSAIVTKEVQRLGGDAAVDVRLSSNMFLFYALLYAQVHPRHRVTGKVIKYRSNQCAVTK